MKRRDRRSGIGIRQSYVELEAVNRLVVLNTERPKARHPVASQFPKVHVERAVLLKHEEDVLNDPGIPCVDGNGRRCGYGAAIWSCCSGVIGRGSARVNRSKALGQRYAWSAHTIVDGERGRGAARNLPTQCHLRSCDNRA